MHVSIIIPALNEARCIEKTLKSLQCHEHPFEVIVVDGGSDDDTCDIARKYARVISAERGRACQMNAGAAVANGDVLLFLHADTILPAKAIQTVRETVLADQKQAGIFRLKFDRNTPLLRFYSFCTRFKNPRFCFGDRALFVQKRIFDQVGGFAPIPIFEDLDLSRKLYELGNFTFLPHYVTTAARRFHQNGPLRQQLLNSYLWFRYFLGDSPDALARHYAYIPSTACEEPSDA